MEIMVFVQVKIWQKTCTLEPKIVLDQLHWEKMAPISYRYPDKQLKTVTCMPFPRAVRSKVIIWVNGLWWYDIERDREALNIPRSFELSKGFFYSRIERISSDAKHCMLNVSRSIDVYLSFLRFRSRDLSQQREKESKRRDRKK